jgi:P4 family phage/plasmid primase-like protien
MDKDRMEDDESTKQWTTVHDFAHSHRVEKGCEFTHTCLGSIPFTFYVPVDSLETFYQLYDEAYKNDDNLFITEKNRHIGPIVADFDFRFDIQENSQLVRAYDDGFIRAVVDAYVKVLNKYFDIKGDEKIYVMEKPSPTLASNTVMKDGLHLVIPNIVSRASIKYLIREEVISILRERIKKLGSINPAEDVIDKSVIEKNNWYMYGSKKYNAEPYLVSSIYNVKDGSPTERERKIKACALFSIRNKYCESVVSENVGDIVATFEKTDEENRRGKNVHNRIVTGTTNSKCAHYENLEIVESIVKILDEKRAHNYHDWIRLGWCLRNIDNRLEDAWEEFSSKSKKYRKGECSKIWNNMRDGGLGLGTLHMWAKEDNCEAYTELMKSDLKNLMYESRSMTDHDVAKVVHHMFQREYVCGSIKNRYWFEFKVHRWVISDSGIGLRLKLSEEVWRAYQLEAIEYTRRAIAATNSGDQTTYQDVAKKFSNIAIKLRSTKFKENIMKECSELFYINKFEENLDSNPNLIGFENGIYDLEEHIFRDGKPEDFVTFSTGVSYIPYDEHSPVIGAINTYMAQVLSNKKVRNYVLKLFASFIAGHVKEQKFYIWTGSGSNSKSKLVELFEKSMGDYCCKFPITLLTQKRVASNAANSELARAKGKRFACLQEPNEDERINIGLMKELSGGDKIMARALYKEPFEFNPQFKMLLLCNHLPSVPSDDGGTWRRIRVVEFTSKFVEDPKKPNEYPIDYDFAVKMQGWTEHFVALLIHYYKKYEKEGMNEPAEVMKCTI